MKLSQLLKPYKPKKLKKRADPFFFARAGGFATSEGGEGGVSESKSVTPENNYGFVKEWRPLKMKIADPTLFFDRQHDWQIENGWVRSLEPDGRYLSWLANNRIMVAKPDWIGSSLSTVISSPKGKPNDIVLMFDPKKALPNTKKMKEFGLSPVFLENRDGN